MLLNNNQATLKKVETGNNMQAFENQQSYSGYTWRMRKADDRLVQVLARQNNISETVSRILVSRGITPETAEAFLHPTLKKNLPHPFTLKDMEKAANRMADSIMAKEPIGLMGDYDVDGATSTASLKLFLEDIGVNVLTFIPEREDGYGPNTAKMLAFQQAGCHLIATLDCGMTAFEPIDTGTKSGLDILVLDHHDADIKGLPNAYAVVNPKRLDESLDHPCRHMAAVGVVFLFIVALNAVLRARGFYQTRPEPNIKRFLDLVAFGTVCDVMKLTGINRLLVKSGLQQMRLGENIGLNALAQLVNLAEAPSTYHLGYVFGPRINACGRVGSSDIGMRLLSSHDFMEAHLLAQKLEELNLLRRDIEADVLLSAIEQVESKPLETPFIFVKGDAWHQGVIGIVAGRLKDKYNLPVFVLSIEGDEVKGSSRSVQGVDLGTLIMNALSRGILTRGGGHPMAAGFSLKKDKLEAFYTYLTENIPADKKTDRLMTLDIDGLIDLHGLTRELAEDINLLAPFGEANPEPVFAIPNVSVARITLLKNGHISCILTNQSGDSVQAIAFRAADTEIGNRLLTTRGDVFHVAGILRQDHWRGRDKIQFQILDLMAA